MFEKFVEGDAPYLVDVLLQGNTEWWIAREVVLYSSEGRVKLIDAYRAKPDGSPLSEGGSVFARALLSSAEIRIKVQKG